MTQRLNHRRGESRHQDNGPTWENATPSAGCNSTHVARARTAWKRHNARKERRTGQFEPGTPLAAPRVRPELVEDDDGSL